ncbi:DUF5081 family protein [Bacillus sonorensis]|uniref:DUF5081 domain-containing protein n=2 Tax=Bacillus sonorensis TaxID=119858 RepID=M5PA17_9BACI|nr:MULTISPECIES: DUF5081 family protein [Bacillus]TWK85444.1 hypothetical protein CHCC20335_2403 [Bacillus paralicheniformis]ASB90513.1 hypothetical protein S101395_04011 [Bacillus sonorensis]EME72125.1 hypothetical protein BSONL12_23585 [Bacillus sonorensis L12]MBG9915224.1 hypothetical protein [Bacillus sonorensis]MCF7619673.1 DUF5081 family protein [Bacillus sonorensis]
MQVKIDKLTAAELYVLAGAAGVNYIFGLPEREQLALVEPDCAVGARDSLIQKGVLTEDGQLTHAAFFLTEMLKHYHASEEYVRFNNVLCAFLPDDEERVIALTEIKPGKEYTFDYLEKREVYLSIISKVSFLRREPREKDRTFLTKPMTPGEKAEVREMDLDEKEILAVETFRFASTPSLIDQGFQTANLYFTKGEDLICIDPLHERYEWVSLYIMNNRIYDALHINFRAGRAMI